MNRTVSYTLMNAALSVVLATWAVYDSLGKSSEFFTFCVEITEGYKLGIFIYLVLVVFHCVATLLLYATFGELTVMEMMHVREGLPLVIINLLFNLINNENLLLSCFLMGVAVISKIFHLVLQDRYEMVNLRLSNSDLVKYSLSSVKVLWVVLTNFYMWLVPVYMLLDFAIAKFLVHDVFQGLNSVTCLLFGFPFAMQGLEMLSLFCRLSLNVYEMAAFRPIPRGRVENKEDKEEGKEENKEENNIDDNNAIDLDDNNNIEIDDIHIENEIDDFDDFDEDDLVWDAKGKYIMIVNIATSSFKALCYLSFVYLLTVGSDLSLPISMLQGTYSSIVNTIKDIKQLHAFIESAKKLNSTLPNADQHDLDLLDNLCIICREDMLSVESFETLHKRLLNPRKHPKKLRCGHIIHMGCLKDWLERSEICPFCRAKVFESEQDEAKEKLDREVQRAVIERLDHIPQPPAQQAQQAQQAQPEREGATGAAIYDLPLVSQPSTAAETESGALSQAHGPAHTLNLPVSVQIPPGWTAMPIAKEGDQYRVSLSTSKKAVLRVKMKHQEHDPPQELALLRVAPLQEAQISGEQINGEHQA